MNYIYILLFFIIILSFWIIFSKSSITSVLCLVGVFLISGICFLLLGAEFIALMVILVYGGAISILFLFIIMMLNLRLVEVYNVNLYYIPFYAFICAFFFFIYLFFFFNVSNIFNFFIWELDSYLQQFSIINAINYKSNLLILGISLYNYFFAYILIAAIILLIAMIGAIYLSLGLSSKNINQKLNNRTYDLVIYYWNIKKKKEV